MRSVIFLGSAERTGKSPSTPGSQLARHSGRRLSICPSPRPFRSTFLSCCCPRPGLGSRSLTAVPFLSYFLLEDQITRFSKSFFQTAFSWIGYKKAVPLFQRPPWGIDALAPVAFQQTLFPSDELMVSDLFRVGWRIRAPLLSVWGGSFPPLLWSQ